MIVAAQMRRLFLAVPPAHVQKRYKYKKKWAVMTKKRSASELALAYFDNHYQPLFGEHLWASMREALLRKLKKYCALVNNFADSENTIVELVSEQEANDMWMATGKTIKLPVSDASRSAGLQDTADDIEQLLTDVEKQGISDDIAETSIAQHMATADNVRHQGRAGEELVATPEGFLIPKARVQVRRMADLSEFIPAAKVYTDRELLEKTQHEQNVLHNSASKLPSAPHEPFRIPHLLRSYIHDAAVEMKFRSPRKDSSGFLDYYLMDGASVLPVLALNLSPSDRVLDLCAAPGGKTLAIVQTLLFESLTCVDSSPSRLKRLTDTLSWYIPPSFCKTGKISIHCKDGRLMGGLHPAMFDKVLVDVPCTTDRHVLHEDDNSLFKPSRQQERLQLPELQTQLLCSALMACRPGGTVVYSTCSLSPGQNDSVVEEACARANEEEVQMADTIHRGQRRHNVAIVDMGDLATRLAHVFKFWSGCRHGQTVLPTTQANFGPLYFSKIKKLPV